MAQFASDAFTGTDATELTAYSASWTRHTSYTGNAQLIINRVRQSTSTTSAYWHSGAPANADYSVSADLLAKEANGGNGFAGVLGRTDTAANTFYHARYGGGASDAWQLYKFVAGTATLLGSSAQSLTSGTIYNVKLEMIGSAIKLFKSLESTALVSVTDTAVTAVGKSGVRFLNGDTQTDDIGIHLDNFSADDISSEQIIILGQPSETDTAQSIAAAKALAVGLNAETDTALALAAVKTIAIGQTSEAGTAQPIAVAKTLAVGQATESDAAITITPVKSATLGQAAGTESATAITAAKTIVIGLATETNTAQPLTGAINVVLGIVTETEFAQALTYYKNLGVLQSAETDSVFAITSKKTIALGQIVEIDSVFPIASSVDFKFIEPGYSLSDIDGLFNKTAINSAYNPTIIN